jgi:hypothetical protein
MIDESANITWTTVNNGTVTIGGIDVAPLCRRVVLVMTANEIPRLVLELDPLAITATVAQTQVEVDSSTAMILGALGWTRPDPE